MDPQMIAGYAAKMAAAFGRPVSPHEAEAEVGRIVVEVAHNLARSPDYRFGVHDRDDVEQQAVLLALRVLAQPGKYDPERPLENFLYRHCRNRLINWKRDEFIRPEPPCRCCDPFDPPAQPCVRWHAWWRRNSAKMGLARPGGLPCPTGGEGREDAPPEVAACNEIEDAIEKDLPSDLRSDYLRMRAGSPVPKARREKVRAAVLEVLDAR